MCKLIKNQSVFLRIIGNMTKTENRIDSKELILIGATYQPYKLDQIGNIEGTRIFIS